LIENKNLNEEIMKLENNNKNSNTNMEKYKKKNKYLEDINIKLINSHDDLLEK
jgi:hypothetical protein